mmetsp:Transcript_40330/g.116560  ORF Transcript_40330/g.116560 Transcript_40330/m.116560 type:complete len:207 (-) Transcript_40330:538-1158(-)
MRFVSLSGRLGGPAAASAAAALSCSTMPFAAAWSSSIIAFRRLMMSRTVAVLLPRSCSTSSTNSGKLISSRLPKSSNVAISTSPETSTPTLAMSRQASGLRSMLPTSSFDSFALSSWSRLSSRLFSSRLTKPIALASFSTAATALTPSTITPTSMFITARVPMMTNVMNKAAKKKFSCPMLNTTSAESGNRPGNSNVAMLSMTVLK